MSKGGAAILGVIGGVAIVASIYGGIVPPAFLGSKALLACGLLFIVGLVLLFISIALFQKSRISTVRIAMGDEAEDDAASLTKMEYAVRHGESAEKHIPKPKSEKFVVPPEVFSTLSRDMTNYSKAAKKANPQKKPSKSKSIKLPNDILRAAKRGNASKKKK